MDPRVQERHHYVEHLLKNCPSDYPIGKPSTCTIRVLTSALSAINSYSQSRLLEINSHSLFSRWFSESGKLVQRLFSNIMEMVEDEDCFVIVLIGKSGVCTDHAICL
jgi:hypothetical protein